MEHSGVIAYHVIMTNYGFWLPNDPRGSWSDYVRSWELFLAGGPATKTDSRRSVAGVRHDFAARERTTSALVRPPVKFTAEQRRAVAAGFGAFVRRSRVRIVACAIMPQHVHLVIDRPPYEAEQAANLLKGAATTELVRCGLHPFADAPYADGRLPTPWARKQWICFLSDDADVRRAIEYVRRNPLKDRLPRQYWSFVVPWEVRTTDTGTFGATAKRVRRRRRM
jgi:REP element-mobilizing transposase RayT